jgi:hypothetical protein
MKSFRPRAQFLAHPVAELVEPAEHVAPLGAEVPLATAKLQQSPEPVALGLEQPRWVVERRGVRHGEDGPGRQGDQLWPIHRDEDGIRNRPRHHAPTGFAKSCSCDARDGTSRL